MATDGAATDVYGMGARIDDHGEGKLAVYDERFKPKFLGNQGDLEWIYIINLNTNVVNIFGGGFSGKSPQHAYRKGIVDPRTYAKQLKDDYQSKELAEIKAALKAVVDIGFKVNSAKKPKTKTKQSDITHTQESLAIVIPLKMAA